LAGRVVVIGGGIGGLGTACLLGRSGYEVTLLEKNERVGGRANLLEDAGFRWDMGPSWYLMPDVFEAFFDLLGEKVGDHLRLRRLSPSYRIFFEDGDVVDMTGDLEADAETFERYEPGAGARLREYLRLSEYQYQVAMSQFVPRNYDSIFEFFNPMLLLKGSSLHVFERMEDYVSRYFSHPKLRQIIQYTLVFLGSSPYTTPALYNIMSHVDFNLGVWYPEGGIYEIVRVLERLARESGVEIVTSCPAEAIVVEGGRVSGVSTPRGIYRADVVVSNADFYHTETRLLPPRYRSYSERYWRRRTLAPSAFIIYLGVRGELPQLLHHNLYFCEDWRTNFAQIFDRPEYPRNPSVYVCCPSRTDPSVAPAGHENLFVLVPIAPGLPDNDEIRRSYAARVLGLLSEKLDIPDLRERVVVQHTFSRRDFEERYNSYRGSALGLAHTLSQSAVFRPSNRSRKVRGLFYVGANTNPGIGMPMCLISAELAWRRVVYGK